MAPYKSSKKSKICCISVNFLTPFSDLIWTTRGHINFFWAGKCFQKNYNNVKKTSFKILPYACHHNSLLIINCSWILTIHKERIVWKNIFESKEMVFKNGVKLYKLWVIMAHVQYIWQFVCSEAPIHTWRARIETIVTQYVSLKMLLRKWFWPFDKAAWRGRLLSGIWEKLRMEALVTITVLCGYFIGHFIARLKRLVKLNRYWF